MFEIIFIIMWIMLFCFFMAAIGVVIFIIIKGIRKNNYNKNQPVVTRRVKIVAKRTRISGNQGHTRYFTTFEFDNGERQEYYLKGSQYGLLAEGDEGLLKTQGTAFHGFDRDKIIE